MRLIDADRIRTGYVPIAPVSASSDVHYEPVVFVWEIDAQPTVDAAPAVHAHWIDTPNYWKCSNCGETYWSMNREFIYCPNCGAKMDEVESE